MQGTGRLDVTILNVVVVLTSHSHVRGHRKGSSHQNIQQYSSSSKKTSTNGKPCEG